MSNILELKKANVKTQKQVVDAYLVLARLGAEQLPVKIAYGLYQLRKHLEPTFTFRMEQERIIVDRYHGIPNGNLVSFEDPEDAKKASAELEEMNELEVQLDFSPFEICSDDFSQALQSMNDLEALDGFITQK